ncbi:hypothetical protein JKF63_02760 [Porcisia hertigi]|uniref:Cyclic nucleotide-binding domain-containing protein n=1 Tax=Porcisia hertigi TaxID=2761500 RepID=A0A836IA34_9TRYP|nr:hypothetical protein JKF63_02760 [Porcisia hertigi]
MMKHKSSKRAFLTDVAFSGPTREDTLSEKDEFLAPLVPFHVPPMPHAAVSKHYVPVHPLPYSRGRTARALPEWERKLILSRLQKAKPLDTDRFQKRLLHAKMRNTREYIRRVRDRVEDATRLDIEAGRASFDHAERRREIIFYKHQNLLEIRRREQTLSRARKWCTIVVCHVFLAALIQERQVQEAFKTFRFLMGPMARRFLALRARRRKAAEQTRQHLDEIPFPSPQVIQSMRGTFFEGWPAALLEKLVEKAKPSYLPKGSYLMHEGDIGRSMFMITLGTISIVLRKKSRDKRRTKENSSGVFELKAPCYAGEFALVCKEPRSASIICETGVGCWAISPEDYDEVAKYLSPQVASKQREATDVRRRENLKRFFPLNLPFLRNFPYFVKFSDTSLLKLIDSVEPIVLHNSDFLFRKGEFDSSTYFVQDGEAVMRDDETADRKILKGTCLGAFECSCGVNEPKRTSVVSINYCDVWRLRRDVLIDIGMTEPSALLHCRSAAKKDRGLQMQKSKLALRCFRKDPYMSFCCPTSILTRLFELSTPTVFLNGERLTVMGQTLNALIFVMCGVVDVTRTRNESQKTSRVHVSADTDSDASIRNANVPFIGLSRVIGAYEFALSLTKYACSVTSVGLTEAFVVQRAQLDACVPLGLRDVMHDNLRSRDCISRAFKLENSGLLYNESALSFARIYRDMRVHQRDIDVSGCL